MAHWLVKSDPEEYSWDDMSNDSSTDWDGVRNYQARNNLKEMKKGERVLFYHSVKDKAVMGICCVEEEHYQDPTTDDDRWVAVKLSYEQTLKNDVTLDQIKENPKLQNIALIKQPRLSVMPLTKDEFKEITDMSK